MIIGIGTDITDIRRIEKTIINFGERFIQRVFTTNEINRCRSRVTTGPSFAKIFAGKEAIVKAIGNTKNLRWQDIEILKHSNGQPYGVLHRSAYTAVEKIINNNQLSCNKSFLKVHLSLSDDFPYATAFAIIEYNYP